MSEEKRRMYKVSRPDYIGGRFCVFKDWATVGDAEFDGAEVGDVIHVELVEMTDAEFEALGEFEGW